MDDKDIKWDEKKILFLHIKVVNGSFNPLKFNNILARTKPKKVNDLVRFVHI